MSRRWVDAQPAEALYLSSVTLGGLSLLKIIQETKPQSISSLAHMTGRKPGNLSRTLKTMSNYGFVEMRRESRQVRPIAKATELRIVA
jgi:hypothetical protein